MIAEEKDWPDGWIAAQREVFVQDFGGNNHIFKFVPGRVTSSEPDRDGTHTRRVAQCVACRRMVEPDHGSTRLHAYKHVFLQIPFDAKGDID